MIVATVKFPEGAWVIMLLVPIMVLRPGPTRTRRTRPKMPSCTKTRRPLAEAPTMRTHAVVVLVDALDAATARAVQYARTLQPDDLRAVHFDLDSWKTSQLVEAWSELGLSRFPLDIVECPDRRMPRAALELASQTDRGWRHRVDDPHSTPRVHQASGIASCTIGRRTRSSRRWQTCHTATSRSCRITSGPRARQRRHPQSNAKE